jgi:TetR/AcrR family tetracycline transcriptional repressor
MTRAGIVEAALRVTQREGLGGLTMRSLADELGTAPMSIYHYVPNKEALTRLVVVEVLAQVRVPGPEAGPWDERLKVLERDARRQLRHHPGVGAVLADHGAELESNRLAHGVITILRQAGFDQDMSYRAFVTLYTFMIGQLDIDGVRQVSGTGDVSALSQMVDGRKLDTDELFEFGFETVLAGLRVRLARHRKDLRASQKLAAGSAKSRLDSAPKRPPRAATGR